MRCFLAIELPCDIAERLTELSARLRGCKVRASWVRTEHMHLTLRFLGIVGEDAGALLGASLRDSFAGIGSFRLHVQGVGAFPTVQRPSVVWAGVGPLQGTLEKVQIMCEKSAALAGLPGDAKPFHPHITLARIKDRAQVPELTRAIERERALCAGVFSVRGVSLFSSVLTPRGPEYARIEEFRFA